jgi:hypothetical protein
MAMRPTLFSIGGAAVELARDPRWIGKVLAKVPADGVAGNETGKRVPGWRIATVLEAIAAYEARTGQKRYQPGAGADGAGAVDEACDELERITGELQRGFERLEAIEDIEERRAAAGDVGPLLPAFTAALERVAEAMGTQDDLVTSAFHRELVGRAFGQLLQLLGWHGVVDDEGKLIWCTGEYLQALHRATTSKAP